MTDDSAGQAAPGYQGAAEPAADLKALDKLVGTWELSGDVGGTVTYEWMKGGFFLIQRVNMVLEDGQENTGIEIIGHERGMGAEPSADIKRLSADGRQLVGAWLYPGGGGYQAISTRIG
jgi:hypothetical protein